MSSIYSVIKVVLFAVFVQHVGKVIYLLGFHKAVYNHKPGSCHLIEGVEYGSEDIQTLPNGFAFITSGMKLFAAEETNKEVKGKIFLFNFANPSKKVVLLELKNFDQETFDPHGISVYKDDETEKITVFVVNHHPISERIEKFEYDYANLSLTHVKTYVDAKFTMMNDVLATSEDTFYVTIMNRFRSKLLRHIEALLTLPLGSVVYYDGKDTSTVASNLYLPNGINWSPDHKFVYVVSVTVFGNGFNVFHRKADMSLAFKERVPVYTGVDNIEVLPNGDIWTGCHPRPVEISQMTHNRSLSASSQVLRIGMKNGEMVSVTEVYSNDRNGIIHGSSAATFYRGKMLIGTVHHKLLYCEIDQKF
ncbi:serum paraoxonase/arylesterase 2-like [Tubulanus polymorphus]|uniref:serum paraoxonase/arylesterase 2-like n=1 Tax=Tubulanus polymorphus TaxID=672921 RepID=UPI003DA65961